MKNQNKLTAIACTVIGVSALVGTTIPTSWANKVLKAPNTMYATSKLPSNLVDSQLITVDINSADAEKLTHVKGIGKKRAQMIVNYRKQHGAFKQVSDLANIPGIGSQRVSRWQQMNTGKVKLVATPVNHQK